MDIHFDIKFERENYDNYRLPFMSYTYFLFYKKFTMINNKS